MSNITSIQIGQNKIQIGKSVLIRSYTNSETHQWYRVYSDGWCEQGGYLDECTKGVNKNVNLTLPYINSEYYANAIYDSNDIGVVSGSQTAINNKAMSSFSLGSQGGSYIYGKLKDMLI